MSGERTEAATPKRRSEVRKRGQSARSRDLTAAAVLIVGLYGIKLLAGSVQAKLSNMLVGSILSIGTFDKTAAPTTGPNVLGVLISVLPPLLGVMALTALAISVVQGGFVFAPGLLSPKFERINPLEGAKRLVSVQGLVATGKTLAKFVAVSATAALVLRSHLDELAGLGTLGLLPALKVVMGLLWDIVFRVAIAMLLLALVDWLWERRRFLQSIRMTKQEVKEEFRQSEGDPQVKAQQRRKREALHAEMMKAVPKADVVITNPTHFAVALKYDPTAMAAPSVVAKGQDFLALRIREAAKEAGVPVMENPPLARTLYKLVPIGQQIPAELYLAVAEVLAFVFRMRGEQAAV